MKKVLSVLMAALFLAAGSSCFAQGFQGDNYGGQMGGFIGEGEASPITSVSKAKKMFDDSVVTIRGNITRRLGDEKYMFRDATGEMMVEIDDEYWYGVTATSSDILELTGEIDRDFNKVKLDVFSLKKITQ
ncbi:hypothetical protein MSI_02490 [Treponema sp. JC4]|jgi:uncharacterized protein (TIGR00156 family)|uniref:YgiW/YdeI family stress tolerance OB fold protein n=1 Tax=Treponema sp. JC4 TaxID=1124982 RepID=UPI00025AFB40|nr:NirD/YgiW/YdeI family stress tolerance protein [Treponema sp. JC4]EID86293.1 hypothetical protein MSI_02490 [Treponema sp. JC4]